jgi:hypothetical protein
MRTEERNEETKQKVIEKNKLERLSKFVDIVYFTESTMDKTHPVFRRMCDEVEKVDPVMEKMRIKCWGEHVGATFIKKIIAQDERKMLQDKVDALKIIKGFHKSV